MRLLSLLALLAACASAPGRATRAADGAWVRSFPADRDTAYHGALWVFLDRGYAIENANPLGGSFTAKSEIEGGLGLRYTRARVDVESAGRKRSRVRIQLVQTLEPSGGGRKPNNDRPVSDAGAYESLFDAIAEVLSP